MEEMCKTLVLLTLLAAGNLAQGFRLNWQKRSGLFQEDSDDVGQRLYFRERVPKGVTTVQVGEQLVLDCWAGGSPEPTIHWYHDDERTQPSENSIVADEEAAYEDTPHNSQMKTMLRLGNTKSRLVVDCVTQADAGSYTCVAETPFKRIVSTTVVKIKPDLSSALGPEICQIPPLPGVQVPARIYMWSAERIEFEGADVQLFCRADGVPTPQVKWYDVNGARIGETEADFRHYRVLPNGDLLVKDITFMINMGNYRCATENDSGSDSIDVFLYPTTP